jgi:hypothetical protein
MKVTIEFRRKIKDIYGNIPDPVFQKEKLYEDTSGMSSGSLLPTIWRYLLVYETIQSNE